MLTAAVPLAACVLMERRTHILRRLFALSTPRLRHRAAPAVAVVVLPALVAVAAAQPVVIHRTLVTQRADAQAFVIFDTSLSMSARAKSTAPTRLQRAVREAETVIPQLGDIPVGIGTMTDRVLPNLMPTTDLGLIDQTIASDVGINRPPPSRLYPGRATTLQSLLRIPGDHLFRSGMTHPILIVFTDGEADPLPAAYGAVLARQLTIPPLFVHVWSPTERIYVHGHVLAGYHPYDQSTFVLHQFAAVTRGQVFEENQLSSLVGAVRHEAGAPRSETSILGYSRISLGPWFVIAGVVPLGFLFWRRNL